jgi:phage I-like protein
MKLQHVALAFEIEAGKEPPKEFRILRKGENSSTKGTFTFDEMSEESTKAYYKKHGPARLMLDYEHKSLDPKAPLDERKASGRFTPEWRDGELWASEIAWTKRAAAEIREGERNYFSPVLGHVDGHVRKLVNCALTNMPALDNIEPLVAASELSDEPPTGSAGQAKPDAADAAKENDDMKTMLALLGVTTEDDGVAKLNELKGAREERDELVKLTEADSFEGAKGIISAGKAASTRVKELEVLEEKRAEEARIAKLDAIIEQGRKDCKLTAAQVEWAKGQSIESLTTFLEHAPKVVLNEDDKVAQPKTKSGNGSPADGKKWEDMEPAALHNLAVSDRDAFVALHEDYKARKASGQVSKKD